MTEVTATACAPGLTAAEVAERISSGQVNRVRRSSGAEYLDIVRRNALTLFNALVVPAAVALFLLGAYPDAISVSGMAAANLLLGLVQELRAKRHLDRLTLLAEGRVRVRRDGKAIEIVSGDVVVDDVVLIEAGDTIPADGEVLEARFLEVDEALLTGESEPVPRRPGDRVLAGSFCVAGEGAYRADRVGAASFAQHTEAEARAYRYIASPLQRTINGLLRLLTATAVSFSALYVVLYFAAGELSKTDLVRMIAATITSMVPQGLVLMTTLAFILGAVRMARRGAVVQRLSAVESMAAIDTLCMDKTGTLTTNRLTLERLHILPGASSEEEVRCLLRLLASTSLDRSNKSLAALRTSLGEQPCELLDHLPFKSQNRYSAVCVRHRSAEHVLVLGAPEALVPFLAGRGAMDAVDTGLVELTKTNLRLLLFGIAARPARPTFEGSLAGFALQPLALIGLRDEIRPDAGEVLAALAEQGIGFKILSGDNPDTVRAAVQSLGRVATLVEPTVVSGAELEVAGDGPGLIRSCSVFGRVSPWQKVEIVNALKGQGRHVAMIGDGVNDVLPIKTAHLGIAMGEGSRASKTVAGLVLETNDFQLLPQTLQEGRTILRNVRSVSKLFLLKNVFTIVLIVGTLGVFQLPFPFLPRQVTLLNFLTIGTPALFIMFRRGRTPPMRVSFLREVGSFVLSRGSVIAAAGLAVMLLARDVWGETMHEDLRTYLLTALVLLGLDSLWRILGQSSARTRFDRRLRWWIATALPIYLLAMYVPAAADFFALTPLSLMQWIRVLGIVVAAAVLARLVEPGHLAA